MFRCAPSELTYLKLLQKEPTSRTIAGTTEGYPVQHSGAHMFSYTLSGCILFVGVLGSCPRRIFHQNGAILFTFNAHCWTSSCYFGQNDGCVHQ